MDQQRGAFASCSDWIESSSKRLDILRLSTAQKTVAFVVRCRRMRSCRYHTLRCSCVGRYWEPAEPTRGVCWHARLVTAATVDISDGDSLVEATHATRFWNFTRDDVLGRTQLLYVGSFHLVFLAALRTSHPGERCLCAFCSFDARFESAVAGWVHPLDGLRCGAADGRCAQPNKLCHSSEKLFWLDSRGEPRWSRPV